MSVPVTIKPIRSLSTLVADAVIEEIHEDNLTITEHPVEQGATIADHAYKMPAELMLTYIWSMGSQQNRAQDTNFLQGLYQQLLQLQVNRTLVQVLTGKRAYQNMLVSSVAVTTDRTTENILRVRVTCREILLTTTQLIQLTNSANMLLPQKTSPSTNVGNVALIPGVNFNPTVAPPGGF